tara:strand:- start:232 stop:936 length:705 start_codon:yes stop_codon:yes gene_type:complete
MPPPPRRPPASSALTLDQWMRAIGPREPGAVGTQVRKQDLGRMAHASGHMPNLAKLTASQVDGCRAPLTRSTSTFALLVSGRPSHLTPDSGLFDALLGAHLEPEPLRPLTSGGYKLKAPLPSSPSSPAKLQRSVRPPGFGVIERGADSPVDKATLLSVGGSDNVGNLERSMHDVSKHGGGRKGIVAQLRARNSGNRRFSPSWQHWTPPPPVRTSASMPRLDVGRLGKSTSYLKR